MKREREEKRKSREDQDALRKKEPRLQPRPLSRELWWWTVLAAHRGVTAGPWLGKQAEGYHSRVEGLGAEAAQRCQQSCSQCQAREE